MAEQLLSPELARSIDWETKTVDHQDKEILGNMTIGMMEKAKTLSPEELRRQMMDSASWFEHAHYFVSSASLTMNEALAPGNERSFAVWARIDGLPIGLGLIVVDSWGKVGGSFCGVDYDYRGRKIGQTILQKLNDELRRRGILEYHTRVWEGSRALFESEKRSGRLTFTVNPEDEKKLSVVLL